MTRERYTSPIAYEHARIHAAAVYCSDGRVGAHFDDFLRNGLGLPRYDRVALPGGPACLAGHDHAHVEQHGVVDELRFLVQAHELEQVVLIAHEGCAFYVQRLGLDGPLLEPAQRADLATAASFVRDVTGLERVAGYLARRDGDRIVLEPVPVEEGPGTRLPLAP